MKHMKINTKDTNFLYEIGCLRFVDRTWRQFHGLQIANVAEHHFRVAWITLFLAAREGIADSGKALKMALAHDIAESRTGDVNYLSRQYTKRDEKLAIEDMLHDTIMQKEFLSLLEEYEARQTLEAKIVKDADNLDVELELQEEKIRGHAAVKLLWNDSREENVYPKLYTESARQFWKEIQASNPHDWHMNARNRFVAGDWKSAHM